MKFPCHLLKSCLSSHLMGSHNFYASPQIKYLFIVFVVCTYACTMCVCGSNSTDRY